MFEIPTISNNDLDKFLLKVREFKLNIANVDDFKKLNSTAQKCENTVWVQGYVGSSTNETTWINAKQLMILFNLNLSKPITAKCLGDSDWKLLQTFAKEEDR